MTAQERIVSTSLAAVGGVVGGFVGYHVFFWILRQGFYGMMIPGALLGLGCGLLARHPSQARGLVCGLAGLALGIYTEWRSAPFKADESLPYFLSHIHQIHQIDLIMIALGGVFAYWLGKDSGFWRLADRKAPSQPDA
jgi:hypothetical protein